MEAAAYPDSQRAAWNLYKNRLELQRATGNPPEYTPPAPGHYWGLYLWDEGFHAIIDARHGSAHSLEAAKTGLRTLVRGQHEDGSIPNFQDLGPRRRFEPERIFGYESREHSNYTQPPVLALAVAETQQAIRGQSGVDPEQAEAAADEFLTEMYPSLKRFYEYFDAHRRNGINDRRIFIIHPHETGRDSDPTYDYLKPYRWPRNGVATTHAVDKANAGLDYFQSIRFGSKLRKANGDVAKARELFGAVDVMMNCILADNLNEMAGMAQQLGRAEDEAYFSKYATEVEGKVLSEMWFGQARTGEGIFYANKPDGEPIQEVSISNLFPLVLENLPEDQLESLLGMMDTSFNTPFPLPSVATTSPKYDPHNRESERLWRGSVWQNTNWYLVERGLRKQQSRTDLIHRTDLIERCLEWDKQITNRSRKMVAVKGIWEFYNPITGRGQRRRRVQNFAWSNLAYVMDVPYSGQITLKEAA